MLIHNVMEDLVYSEVNKLFDAAAEKNESWLTCSCIQCRLDTMSYVLNRIAPQYIKSGRGMAHFMQMQNSKKIETIATISSLAITGMKQVLKNKRPHSSDSDEAFITDGAVFNFPAITGSIRDGQSLAPLYDIPIYLEQNGSLVKQIHNLWQNPYTIAKKTAGTYTFWPRPVAAEKAGIEKTFPFVLRAEKEGHDTIIHEFRITVTSSKSADTNLNLDTAYKLPDLYFFKK